MMCERDLAVSNAPHVRVCESDTSAYDLGLVAILLYFSFWVQMSAFDWIIILIAKAQFCFIFLINIFIKRIGMETMCTTVCIECSLCVHCV